MNVCLKILRLSSGEENFSWNFVPLDQIFSRHGKMNDKENGENVVNDEEKEEAVSNIDELVDDNIDTIYGKEIALSYIATERNVKTTNTNRNSKYYDESKRTVHKSTNNNCEQLIYGPSWSTGANFGDLVCFGATILIVLLLLSILIFYVFKDNERDIDT